MVYLLLLHQGNPEAELQAISQYFIQTPAPVTFEIKGDIRKPD